MGAVFEVAWLEVSVSDSGCVSRRPQRACPLENFGVMYHDCADTSGVWMAPAYDIVSTTPYKPQDTMALLMADSKNWPKRKLLMEFGRRSCQLGEGRCKDLLKQVADGMSKARGELLKHIQYQTSFEKVGSRMLSDWDRGLARSLVPEARSTVVDLGTAKGRDSDT